MKVGVVGSRTFRDYTLLHNTLDKYDITTIVSGGAKGADLMGERYAYIKHIPTIIHKPDWSIGKQAGYLRNVDIVNDSDMIIAFWDGISKGTKHTIDLARKKGKKVVIIEI